MRLKSMISASLVAGLVASASLADDDDGEKRYPESEYRHQLMEQVKYSAQPLLAIAKGELNAPEGALAHNASVLEAAAKASIVGFKKDTRGMDGRSDSKDNVWEDWADFSQRMEKFHADTVALTAAIAGGDEGTIKAATFNVFKNCKSCHDDYRAE